MTTVGKKSKAEKGTNLGSLAAERSTPEGKAPRWATGPFKRFLDELKELDRLVHLSMRGISMLRASPVMRRIAEQLHKQLPEEATRELPPSKHAEREAEFAEAEIKNNFPALHGWAVISLWSALEGLVKSFVADWLGNVRESWKSEKLSGLSVRIGEYESLPEQERHLFIADLLQARVKASGVSKFEEMLATFGLSQSIAEPIKIVIYEMAKVRNLLVHRGGVVDREFKDACPWLEISIGDKFVVDPKRWHAYNEAVADYSLVVFFRVAEEFGCDFSAERAEWLERVDNFWMRNQTLFTSTTTASSVARGASNTAR